MPDSFTDQLLELGATVLRGVDVSVKTNYTPEIRIPTGDDATQPGFVSELLGVRAGVILRNSRGEIIETIGDPAPTDPFRATAAIVFTSLIAIVFVRGVLK